MMTKLNNPAARPTFAFVLVGVAILGFGSLLQLFAQGFGPPPGGGGQAADRDDRPQGPPGAEVVAGHLLQEFDADGDQALSLAELTAALEALHQRRPQGPPQGGGISRPAD